jgi:biopolymer transport protein ExbB/TolQ
VNILAGLETFLYVIASSLFYPVIIALLLLTFWIVVCAGSMLREYLERRQGQMLWVEHYRDYLNHLPSGGQVDLEVGRELQKMELGLVKSLNKVRFAIRVGPALGLMGTLIPMGISLAALAQGDMPKMASSMVTAFTTTVVGLACGVAAYLMALVKERWVRADMAEMEYLTELQLRMLGINGSPTATTRGGADDKEILDQKPTF